MATSIAGFWKQARTSLRRTLSAPPASRRANFSWTIRGSRGGRKDPEFYQKIIDDPFLGSLAWDINEQSARQCREWADRVGTTTSRQRFVAGAIGPLTVSLSNSPDADDPGFRVVTFDQVKAAYAQQVRALIAGGVDLLLVETIFDSLNAKAALVAIRDVFDE